MPERDAARVYSALADLRRRHPQVAWLPPEKLHLTLVFLGQTDAARAGPLAEAISEVAARHEQFRVMTGEAGGRVGGRRGGVAWLRLREGGGEVAQLALALDDTIGSATYDAQHSPHPHLTVARKATEEVLRELRALTLRLSLSWAVDRVVLLRSHTNPGGSVYEELFSFSLRRGLDPGAC